MYKYIVKRVLFVILTILVVSILIFWLMDFMPGSAGRSILGMMASQEAVDQLNEELGENDPFFTRYFRYMYNFIFKFDLGTSYQFNKPVWEIIMSKLPCTFTLTFFSTLFVALFGLSIGVYSAVHQYGIADNFFIVLSMVVASIPQFWLGMLLMLIFALRLHWLPSYGIANWTGFILPVVTASLLGTARLLRLTRAQMLENIRADFIRTARAKGAAEGEVVWKHAFEASLVPLVNSIGVRFGTMLGGSVVIETVFSLPGLGFAIMNAMSVKDVPLIEGCMIFLTTCYCIVVLITDILNAYIDPRIKAKYSV